MGNLDLLIPLAVLAGLIFYTFAPEKRSPR